MRGEPRADAQCTVCHAAVAARGRDHHHHEPESEGARCVACHMPPLTVERGHGVVADHTIGSPWPALGSDRVALDACTSCHTGARGVPPGAPPLTENEIRRAHARWWPDARPPAWVEALARARRGESGAGGGLVALLADADAPSVARATAARLLAGFPAVAEGAIGRFRGDADSLVRRHAVETLVRARLPGAAAALAEALRDPAPAVRSRAARAALERPEMLAADAALLEAVVGILAQEAAWAPDDDLRFERLARARELAGDLAGARAAWERKARLDPLDRYARERAAALGRAIEAREGGR